MDVYLLWKNLVESNLYFHWCIKHKTILLHKYCRQKHNNLAEESNSAAAKGKQCRKNEVELSRHKTSTRAIRSHEYVQSTWKTFIELSMYFSCNIYFLHKLRRIVLI